MRARSFAIAVVVAVAACGEAAAPLDGGAGDRPIDGYDPFRCAPTIGDLTAPIELMPIGVGSPDGTPLTDGAVVPMMAPPQGGLIVLVGVRARNVDGCQVQLTAGLRDPGTGQVVAVESRPSQLRLGGDGWGVPVDAQFFSMSNLALCPSAGATRDLYDQPWQLELSIDDRGRPASTTVTIVPTCTGVSPIHECPCLCDADYEVGQCGGGGGGGG